MDESEARASETSDREKRRKALLTSLDVRKFEIDLFWKRSLFFWGFLALTFVIYGTTKKEFPNGAMPLAAASFGTICSLCWHLVNRGSKYWQENWETKVGQLEEEFIGTLFGDLTGTQRKRMWSAWRYSVGKITLALSAFVGILWLLIFLNESYRLLSVYLFQDIESHKQIPMAMKGLVIFLLTVISIPIILVSTKTSQKPEESKSQ